jgi:hypothetical protein
LHAAAVALCSLNPDRSFFMEDVRPHRGLAVCRWVLLVLGGIGVAGAMLQLGRGLLRGAAPIDNPVFANVQRLPHDETLLRHASSYGLDLLILAPWLLLLLVTAYVGAVLLLALFRTAPVAVLVAGAFLGGALLSGLLIFTSLIKVVEFAVQSQAATATEVEWLAAGINYLTQVHIFYVSAWILATGVGWLCVGAAARGMGPAWRRGSLLLLAGGTLFVTSWVVRLLLPLAGMTAPAVLLGVVEAIPSAAFGCGLLGYASLVANLNATTTTAPQPQHGLAARPLAG